MSVTALPQTITVALIGNPNTGKSTLFSALAGVRQQIGNYPGVTVEKKIGRFEADGHKFALVDLPGTYSLAPRSPDEMIAVDVLLGRRDDVHAPDVILCIVDASNLERNLYVVSQVLELGLPTVIALSMVDVAEEKGLKVDIAALRQRLQVPIVPVQAHRKRGLTELTAALAEAAAAPPVPRESHFPAAFQEEVAGLSAVLTKNTATDSGERLWPRYLVERLLLDTGGYLTTAHLPGMDESTARHVAEARERLMAAGCPVPGVEPVARYRWVSQMLKGIVERPRVRKVTWSDRFDRVLTHKVAGSLVFVLLMALMFQCVFWVAAPASWLIETASAGLSAAVETFVADGPLHSLLVNGVIAGVGGVLVFLPQIFILFFFIGILEDCGYMARAAYLMDRLMSRVGLSGKSFIPLLSSFACAIPGIMAARVIENRRDRLVTILVAPLMSCSARLPVYTLLIAAFIPAWHWGTVRLLGWEFHLLGLQGLTMLAMYSIGMVAAVVVALVLKRTILRGAAPPFVMELPSYKIPSARLVLTRMWDSGVAFVRRAGTLIFAVSIVVWALAYYPHDEKALDPSLLARRNELVLQIDSLPDHSPEADVAGEELATVQNQIEGAHLRNSFLGQAGRFIEPVVRPLGWDWRLGCAAIASFPAREVVVAMLGVIYNLGSEEDEASASLRDTLAAATWDGTDRKVFNVPVALSLMVFFALCAQCASTLAVMRRETNSWRWPAFAFVYMTVLAYVAALVTYQVGIRLM